MKLLTAILGCLVLSGSEARLAIADDAAPASIMRHDTERAIRLFMDGCVAFVPSPNDRPHWLRDHAKLRMLLNHGSSVTWVDQSTPPVAVVVGDDGTCAVMAARASGQGAGPLLEQGLKSAGIALETTSEKSGPDGDRELHFLFSIANARFDVGAMFGVKVPGADRTDARLPLILSVQPQR